MLTKHNIVVALVGVAIGYYLAQKIANSAGQYIGYPVGSSTATS